MADTLKSLAAKLFGDGKAPVEIVRLVQSQAIASGVHQPSKATIFRWVAAARDARAEVEAMARADAQFAARPTTSSLRVLPGGARADEVGETPEEWSDRVLGQTCDQYGGALAREGLSMLKKIARGEIEGVTPQVRIMAHREIRETWAMLAAMRRGVEGGKGAGSGAVAIDFETVTTEELQAALAGESPAAAAGA